MAYLVMAYDSYGLYSYGLRFRPYPPGRVSPWQPPPNPTDPSDRGLRCLSARLCRGVLQEGFGIGYLIKDDYLNFSISSFSRQTTRFVDALENWYPAPCAITI